METRIDNGEIYRWFDIFRPDGALAELRVIKGKETWSGYFHDAQSAINALCADPYLLTGNVYQIFNGINEACAGRPQYGKFIKGCTTTSDNDICGRNWVFLDIDTRKPANTNAPDADVDYVTKIVANRVYTFLKEQGLSEPVVIFSGNGVHFYIPCRLQNNEENKNLLSRFTKALGMLFNDERVEIDPVIINAARMAKMPGTVSGKGRADDAERPQRMCRFVKVPDVLRLTDKAFFEKIAALLPEPPKPSRENDWGREPFDLEAFIAKHGIKVKERVQTSEGTRFILEHCIFNDQHRGKDAMLFRWNNGAIAYKCLHASCSQYTWRDVRLHFEPDAYSRRDYDEYKYKRRLGGEKAEVFVPQEKTEEKGEKWLSLKDVRWRDPKEDMFIPTAYTELDRKIRGLALGEVSVLSGCNASGKTSFLDCLALNAIQAGYKTAIWSGELPAWKIKSWINLVAAGPANIRHSDGDFAYVPRSISEKIDAWDDGKLFVYNNDYGFRAKQILYDAAKIMDTAQVQLLVLDNLMALDMSEMGTTNLEQQKMLVFELREMAKKRNIHVVLVAHPRKQMGFLRKEDISGTADITNLADNVFIIHRRNNDFLRRAQETLGQSFAKVPAGDSILEVCKNRDFGVDDFYVGFFFDPYTKRFKNTIDEVVQYGWDDTPRVLFAGGEDIPDFDAQNYGIDEF